MTSTTPVRERLVDAAFDLFDQRGFEQTTIEDITARANVGRTTFFRHYRSKEDVIFPDHDRLLATINDRLATSTADTALVAVSEAVRLVLMHYIDEGERARRRYALTSSVPTLRNREIASVARYQRLFREFIAAWFGPAPRAALSAELMAAAVVSAHNHVLRRWLRQDTRNPISEIDQAMTEVVALFANSAAPTHKSGSTVIVLNDQHDPEHVITVIRRALHQPQAPARATSCPTRTRD